MEGEPGAGDGGRGGGGIAPDVVGERSGGIGWGAYKPSVPPMDDVPRPPPAPHSK